jgi:hypothetical protein
MVWISTNPITQKELLIYRYLVKNTQNPIFAKRFIDFINLHDYLIKNKYRYHTPTDIQKDVPFLTLKESQQILDLLSIRGGSQYPIIDNVVRTILDWMYKWTPGSIGNIAAKGIVQIRHFSDIFIPLQFRELYNLTLKLVTIMIREQIIGAQSIPKESGFFNSIANFIVTTVISMFTVLLNILNITDDDIGATFVDSFLILPSIGLLIYKSAQEIEPKLQKFVQQRKELIDLVRKEYNIEAANELQELLPDPGSPELEQYNFPDIDRLMKARDILIQFLQNPENELKLKQQISALALQIKPTSLQEHQQQLQEIASKYPSRNPLTGGAHHKKKWVTRRRSNL